jgi:hypothetical protein
LNAAAVIERAAQPDLGDPLLWNLGGHGLRSMLWSPAAGAFFLVTGASTEGSDWSLYRWSGERASAPSIVRRSGASASGAPEALAEGLGPGRLLALTDDGDLRVPVRRASECKIDAYRSDGTCRNKDLREASAKTFHGFEIVP